MRQACAGYNCCTSEAVRASVLPWGRHVRARGPASMVSRNRSAFRGDRTHYPKNETRFKHQQKPSQLKLVG